MSVPRSLKLSFVKLIWRLTPNCAEMARLSSAQFEGGISPGTRVRMRLHYVICRWCQRYSAQLRFLQQATGQSHNHIASDSSRGLSNAARDRIKICLRKAQIA